MNQSAQHEQQQGQIGPQATYQQPPTDYTRTYTPTHQIGPIKYEQRDDSFRRPVTPPTHYPTQFSTPTPSASSQYTAAVLGQVNRPKYDEWLKVEVCREFQRDKCNRKPSECKYAHPKPNICIENGKVTACYDFLKGKCHRDACRFIHPENPNIKADFDCLTDWNTKSAISEEHQKLKNLPLYNSNKAKNCLQYFRDFLYI
jgi:hypothetical protein